MSTVNVTVPKPRRAARQRRQPKSTTSVNISASSSSTARKTRRSRASRRGPSGITSKRRAYQQSLLAPFTTGGVRLGHGCMVPTSLKRLYRSVTQTVNSTRTGQVWINGPGFYNTGDPTSGVTKPGYLSCINYTSADANISNITNESFNYGTINSVQSHAEQLRIVSAGLRINVRTAGTSLSPVVYAGFVRCSYLDLVSSTPNQLSAQDEVHLVPSDGSGTTNVEVQYRPEDPSSFEFHPLITEPLDHFNDIQPWFVVLIMSAPGNSTPVCSSTSEAVAHWETQSGIMYDDGDEEQSSIETDQLQPVDVTSVVAPVARMSVFDTFIDSVAEVTRLMSERMLRGGGLGIRGRR